MLKNKDMSSQPSAPFILDRECNDLVCFFDVLGAYDLVCRLNEA